MFITFEGIDASGKTTQADILYSKLQEKNIEAINISNPGSVKESLAIRQLLLSEDYNFADNNITALFLISHKEITDKVIRPALAAGKIVICNRYIDSTIAYQGRSQADLIENIKKIQQVICPDLLTPDITFFMDITVNQAYERLSERNSLDAIEKKGKSYFNDVREGFLSLANSKESIIKINAGNSIKDSEKEIWQNIKI